MSRVISLLLIIFALFVFPACGGGGGDGGVGGPCESKKVPGVCTVTSITDADATLNNCKNHPVVVAFTFTPDNPAENTDSPNTDNLTVDDGKNLPLDYIQQKGLAVGSEYKCNKHIITKGPCINYFDHKGLDLSDYAQSCF